MKKYQLINYFDVWGNDDDGFEVNNQCRENIFIEIDENTTKENIIEQLIENGFLKNKANINNVDVDWFDDHFIELFESGRRYPLCALELVNE